MADRFPLPVERRLLRHTVFTLGFFATIIAFAGGGTLDDAVVLIVSGDTRRFLQACG